MSKKNKKKRNKNRKRKQKKNRIKKKSFFYIRRDFYNKINIKMEITQVIKFLSNDKKKKKMETYNNQQINCLSNLKTDLLTPKWCKWILN